ncbi:MAG: hypothetical protein ACLRQF_01535 [Thomasclavelia ramosa]
MFKKFIMQYIYLKVSLSNKGGANGNKVFERDEQLISSLVTVWES